MHLKLILFVILCFPYISHAIIILSEELYVGDVVDISIQNLKIIQKPKTKLPKMMISVIIDKTLGYNIDPFFPCFVANKVPTLHLDLNATDTNVILSQSTTTVAFQFDFTTATWNEVSFPKMVHLYPNISSIATYNKNAQNQTKQMIEMSSSQIGSNIFYNLSFVLPIESAESAGIYKLFLHSDKKISTEIIRVSISYSWYNISLIWCIVRVGAHFIMLSWALFRSQQNRGTTHDALYCIIFCFFPIFNLAFSWTNLKQILNTSSMEFGTSFVEVGKSLEETYRSNGWDNISLMCFVLGILLFFMCFQMYMYLRHCQKIEVMLFQLFVWLMLIYVTVQSYEMGSTIQIRTGLSFTILAWSSGFMTIFESTILLVNKLKDIDRDSPRYQHVISLTTRSRYLHTIYAIIVSFHLIWASMIWLQVPFYLASLQFAIEETLFVTFWYYVCLPNCLLCMKIICVWEQTKENDEENELKKSRQAMHLNNAPCTDIDLTLDSLVSYLDT